MVQLQSSITKHDLLLQRGQLAQKSPLSYMSPYIITCHLLTRSPPAYITAHSGKALYTKAHSGKGLPVLVCLCPTTELFLMSLFHKMRKNKVDSVVKQPQLQKSPSTQQHLHYKGSPCPVTHILLILGLCFQTAFSHQTGLEIRKGNNQ